MWHVSKDCVQKDQIAYTSLGGLCSRKAGVGTHAGMRVEGFGKIGEGGDGRG
jgi:hypothetical protein